MVSFLLLSLHLCRRGLCRTRSAQQFTVAQRWVVTALAAAVLSAVPVSLFAQHFDVALPWSAAVGEHVTFNEHGLIEYRYDFERLAVTRRRYDAIDSSEIRYMVQDQPGETAEHLVDFAFPRPGIIVRHSSTFAWAGPMGSWSREIRRWVSPDVQYRVTIHPVDNLFTGHSLTEVRRNTDGGFDQYSIRAVEGSAGWERIFPALASLDWSGVTHNSYGEGWQDHILDLGPAGVASSIWIDVASVYGGFLMATPEPVDHADYGFELGPRSSLPAFEEAERVVYEPTQLRRELEQQTSRLRRIIANQAYEGYSEPGAFVLPLMDETYTDLLRRLYFHLGNHHYYDNHALAAEFFRYSLFFTLRPTDRFTLDLPGLVQDAAARYDDYPQPYLHDNRALHALMRPDSVLPLRAAYAAYNIGCLLSLQEDPAALDWLIISRYLGFPNYASHAAADPDLAFVRQRFAAQFEAISTAVFDQEANLPQYRDLPLGKAP